MVPLLSTSKADSGLASEFRWDRAIYTAYERMLKVRGRNTTHQGADTTATTNRTSTHHQQRSITTTTATRLASNDSACWWDCHNVIEYEIKEII